MQGRIADNLQAVFQKSVRSTKVVPDCWKILRIRTEQQQGHSQKTPEFGPCVPFNPYIYKDVTPELRG